MDEDTEEERGTLGSLRHERGLLVLGLLDQGKYENTASKSETFIKDSVWGGGGKEEKACWVSVPMRKEPLI